MEIIRHPRAWAARRRTAPRGPGRRPAPAGDHDRIRLGEKFRTAVGHQADAAGSAQRPFIDGGDGELVPVVAHFRARQAEDLHGYAKLKGAQAIVGEGDHLMT
jgi:hypothetical protein